jgi:phage shock protein PspC (stress-responsive transcriptional regulator)
MYRKNKKQRKKTNLKTILKNKEMNKTIIINISGIIFHIEEDAYELLKSYMNDIKKYFSNSEDSFEIVTDIENRVAEMFSELLKKENKQVITSVDVEGIITQMGKASDFGYTNESEVKDEAYEYQEEIKKRLYRNGDDKIVGGVCSGIAAYFNTDPLWIRLALVFSLVFFGTGILLYILLWVIMPEAKTRAEKLAMRGEKININTIKNSVEEELSALKKKYGEGASQLKYSGGEQMRGFIQNVIDLIGRLLIGIVKVLKVLTGIFISGMSAIFLICFGIMLLAGLGVMNSNHVSMPFPFNIIDPGQQNLLYISAFIAGTIPALALLFLGLRIAFNTKMINKVSALSALGIWIVALSITAYQAVNIASQFKEEGRLKTETPLHPVTGNTLYLNVGHSYDDIRVDTFKTKMFGYNNGRVVISSDKTKTFYDDIDIRIERSDSKELKLVTIYGSRGKDEQTAIKSAAEIEYGFSQKDSVLNFDDFCTLKNNAKWRIPHVELTLYVPENMKLVIHDDVDRLIHNIYSGECKRSYHQTFWTMTNYGLVCEEEKLSNDSSKVY